MALMVGAVAFGYARPATRSTDLLEILPDGGGVVVIDVQKITGSALWATMSAQQKLKGFVDKAQSEITDLGLEWNDVRTVALVFPSANLNNPITAMSGGFDQKELLERLRSNTKVNLSSDKYKGFDLYTAKPVPHSDLKNSSGSMSASTKAVRSETSFAFRDASTIVVGPTESVRASIDVMTGAKRSVTQNSQLADGLAQVPSAAITFAMVVTPSVTAGLQSSELPIPDFSSLKLIFGSIDVTSGIDINATLRSDSAENAKSMAVRLNGLLDMARGYLGAANNPKTTPIVDALKVVSITSSNIDVKITGSFPSDLLTTLFTSGERKSQ
jgi:hypothetical protein